MYPEKLTANPIPEFSYSTSFKNSTGPIRSYYHRSGFPIGMHSHSFYEINIIDRGKGRHYIENRSCPANAGDIFILPPNTNHGYWEEENLSVFHLLLGCDFMDEYRDKLSSLPGFSTLFTIEPALRQEQQSSLFLSLSEENLAHLIPLFDALINLNEDDYSGINLIRSSLSLSLIGILCKNVYETFTEPKRKVKHSDLPIMIAMEYIHQNLSDKISVDKLAERANMSRSTFLRGFKRLSGISPVQYQTQCRIERAKELMRYTDRSVTQIAIECGFYDTSHFDRIFNLYEGYSPRIYRQTKDI